jgi:hypothetical protein
MMGHQVEQAALFYEFSLEIQFPADHRLRSIDRFVELFGRLKINRSIATRYDQLANSFFEWSISGARRSHRLIDLSGFVHNLNVVTVGVKYPGCIIVRMILELGRRCSFLPAACCDCRYD